jgi:SAM-dependent methyltransferase
MMPPREAACPLCGAPGPFETAVDVRKRRHRLCGRCKLIFVEDRFLPAPEAERERYAKHRCGLDDSGYVAFLRQALDPALPFLNPGMRGLDYGCGHSPTLCLLLEKEGVRCENFDPFFFPDLPAGPFDFLFATEVVEHFFHPAADWARMAGLLKPGGLLVAMTAPGPNLAEFATWGYASDETHVCFYFRETLDWICGAFGFDRLDRGNPRVSLLRKR